MTSQRTLGLRINPGHTYVKIVLLVDRHEPATVTLPALVREAQQLLGVVERIRSVGFGTAAWWIGDDALIGNESRTAFHQVQTGQQALARHRHQFSLQSADKTMALSVASWQKVKHADRGIRSAPSLKWFRPPM